MFSNRSAADIAPIATVESLAEAGLTAYQQAVKARLPLAYIAEQSGRPQYWFAGNMLQVVGASATASAGGRVFLGRKEVAGLMLSADMSALLAGKDIRYKDLCVSPADFGKYMDWARTVQ